MVLAAGLAFCLALSLYLFNENRHLRDEFIRQNEQTQAELKRQTKEYETLIRWHIHVSAKLDMEPVIDGKDVPDAQRPTEPGREEATE